MPAVRAAHPREAMGEDAAPQIASEDLGIPEYRQVLVGPYRVIYRVVDAAVFVMVVADGRRDMSLV